MAIPTLLLPLDGDLDGRDRDGPFTATGNGALRWVPGMAPGTQAAMIEESTTNLIRNPHAATLNGIGGNDIAFELVEGFGPEGIANSVRFTSDASSGFEYAIWSTPNPVGGPTTARTFTGSIWVFGEAGLELDLVMRIRMLRGGSFRNHDIIQSIICTGEWTRFTVTGSTQNGDDLTTQATSIQVARSYSNFNIRSAATFYATGAQFEEKPYATTLCPQLDRDGNLLPGYAWTGTEHNSPSTRTVSHLSFNPLTNGRVPLDRGTIALRARFSDIGSSGRDQIAFSHYSAGQNRLYLGRRGNGTGMVSIGGLHPAILGGSVPPDEWVDLAMQYDGEQVWLRVNDEIFGPVAYSGLNQLGVTASIGRSDSDNSPSAAVGGVIITRDLLSDDEWARLRQQPEWRWNTLIPTPGGVLRVDGGGAPFSVLRSGSGGAPFSVLRAGYGEE